MAMSRNRERTNSRAVIYSRLSPRIRPDGSESCEKQIEICQRYCDFCKLEVIGVFYDLERIDTAKDYSRYFYKTVSLFVKLERELVSERTSDAVLRHQRAGGSMSFLPPYGMKNDPKDPTK